MGAGVRVMLRFDEKCVVRGGAAEGGIGLFPGMIVGVKGRNAGGGYFSVNEIFQVRTRIYYFLLQCLMFFFQVPPTLHCETPVANLREYQFGQSRLNGDLVSIIIASGPYTTDTNLDFAPFEALCEEVKKTRPDVVVLVSGHGVYKWYHLLKIAPARAFHRL
jgi:DNA polymerase alpha subunit B